MPPLFDNPEDFNRIKQCDGLELGDVRDALQAGTAVSICNTTKDDWYEAHQNLSAREIEIVQTESLINVAKAEQTA